MTEAVVVYKCSACGDVFPLHDGDALTCPSCGSGELDMASEPLL